ncbi:YfhO family protein [Streptococcus cuniculipharyngis]|uniref:YfhO family protein n=1 Tax=Streptococcus cuniculipharyngis TaxID=1562651 RepID=A0A5C5SD03_9STRE|nr:YfhO family protein [Streptococcus cuniculipharyngis]TWS97679.1 YfhO family protein [Streptococcus cuniculipharyngis]
MFNQKKIVGYFPFLLIALSSFVMILPQWLGRDVIFGSDSIFHYNRFYDAAMQIKSLNLNYFISIYGFQQSGRIVNALYGPFFAYFQGILVLLSKNWFGYQLLSRFVLGLFAGNSMYALLREVKVRGTIALALAIFYLTTFSIQYWSIRQGFSSWGAALMPYCLIPMIRLIFQDKIEVIRLAVSVALMLQVHVLSALFLVMMYVPFYLYGLMKSSAKLKILGQTTLSVVLAVLLTLNIWTALIFLRQDNLLLDPFVNPLMGKHTINQASSYWLTRPQFLFVLFIAQLGYFLFYWKKVAKWEWVLAITYFLFFFLSTSYFPWQDLVDRGVKFAELIQFPFRFFIPTTVLLIVLAGRALTSFQQRQWLLSFLLSLAVIGAMVETSQYATQQAEKAHRNEYVLKKSKHVYLFDDYQQTRASLFDVDKRKLLRVIQKATPDYVPVYGDLTGKNTYKLYAQQIIFPNSQFKKSVTNHQLSVEWTAQAGEKVSIPIFVYTGSQLTLNGVKLMSSDYQLSEIGVPLVTSQQGMNKLVLTYQAPLIFTVSLVMTSLAWLGIFLTSRLHFKKLTSKA